MSALFHACIAALCGHVLRSATVGDRSALSNGRSTVCVAVSCDGTLVAGGCTERLLAVCDASRPDLGPLAQVRRPQCRVLTRFPSCPSPVATCTCLRTFLSLLLALYASMLPCCMLCCMLCVFMEMPSTQFLTYGDVTAIGLGPGIMPWPRHQTEPEGYMPPTFNTFHDEVLPRCGDGFGRIGTCVVLSWSPMGCRGCGHIFSAPATNPSWLSNIMTQPPVPVSCTQASLSPVTRRGPCSSCDWWTWSGWQRRVD